MDKLTNPPTTKDVLAYVVNPENVTDSKHGRMCGDGRYKETKGKLARFGADGGYVLGLLALNKSYNLGLTPENIVDSVVEASTKDGSHFSIHTDSHEGNDPYSIGCGHLSKASLPENEEKYGVSSEDVKNAVTYIKSLAKTNPDKVEIEKLEGDHNEKGVLLNMGKRKKIHHMRGHEQWFIVAAKRDQDYVNNVLFPRLQTDLPQLKEIGVDKFQEILNKQTEITAQILAKGLPVFHVNLDDEKPVVIEAGVI